jgi:hypothetical protein
MPACGPSDISLLTTMQGVPSSTPDGALKLNLILPLSSSCPNYWLLTIFVIFFEVGILDGTGIWIESLVLARQVFYHLRHIPVLFWFS